VPQYVIDRDQAAGAQELTRSRNSDRSSPYPRR
jgi:hypothetical protein